jgi:hypothetical protein
VQASGNLASTKGEKIKLAKAFNFIYALFFLALLSGLWIHDIFVGLYAITLLALASPVTRESLLSFWGSTNNKVGKKFLIGTVLLLSLQYALSWYFNYQSLQVFYFDFGQYVQIIHNYAKHGAPIYTARDQVEINYFLEHRSLSIFLLAGLYRIFPSAVWIIIYQVIGSLAPALILVILSLKRFPSKWVRASLVFFGYTLSPNFLGQALWPYTLHILGPTLLLLAYICFDEKKSYAWFFCLLLLILEKEEFGIFSLGFAFAALWKIRKDSSYRSFLIFALALLPFSVWGLSFTSQYGSAGGFAHNFGDLGVNPKEAVLNLLLKPWRGLELLARPTSVFYISYFIFFSMAWLKPRIEVWISMLPVLGLLIVNALAVTGPFQHIDAHYSALIHVGVYFTLVFKVLPLIFSTDEVRNTGILALIVGAGFLIPLTSISHNFVDKSINADSSSRARRNLEPYFFEHEGRSETMCCEEPLCGNVSGYRHVYFLNECPKSTKEPTYFVYTRTGQSRLEIPSQARVIAQGDDLVVSYLPLENSSK